MTSVSTNVYIDKLDDIVNKYNNTNHSKIKMKSVHIKPVGIFILVKKMINTLSLRLLSM